jgi:hypothetical protein
MPNIITATVPQIWSKTFLKNFDKSTAMLQHADRSYETDFANYGDTVHVPRMGDLAVGNYHVNSSITFQDITTTDDTMVLNQTPYIAFRLDDIEKAVSHTDLAMRALERARTAMEIHIDSHLLGIIGSFTHTVGSAAAPIALSGQNVINAFRDAGLALDNANVQEGGRVAVVPPTIFDALARYADAKDVDSSLSNIAKAMPYREVAGFKLFKSTNIPKVGSGATEHFVIPAFIEKTTFSHALRLNPKRVEKFRAENSFGDALKMLAFYGSKVFEPTTGVRIFIRTTA